MVEAVQQQRVALQLKLWLMLVPIARQHKRQITR